MKKVLTTTIAGVVALSLLAGCGAKKGDEISPDKAGSQPSQTGIISNDPITLKIAISMNWLGADEFKKYFEDPVKKRYPNLTFEIMDMSKPEFAGMDKILATGTVPDIVMSASPIMYRVTDFGVEEDLMPLVKKHNFNLSKIHPTALESVKTAYGSDVLTGLPWTRHVHATYYNKNIFDKFGVTYPKDGMTWDDARELAKKLTRTEGEIQFRGMEPDIQFPSVLQLSPVDPVNKKASLNTDGWKKAFGLSKSFYDIPGNSKTKFSGGAWDQFMKEQTLAMYPAGNNLPNLKSVGAMNWDIAQYPSFSENPNMAPVVDMWILHITKQSKNKDAAFQVLASILSDEVQLEMAKNARFPVVETEAVRKEFGKNLPHLQGKHLEAVFKSQPSKAMRVTKYHAFADGIIQKYVTQVANGQKDINTALREADEELNKKIMDNP